MKETANSIHCFHLKNLGGPKWRKQETQFISFHLKNLEAQRETNTKPNSLVITAKFWRPKVKGTGISIHYFLSEKFWNRTKAKKTKNSIHHFSRQNFWGAKCRKQETQFASSHFKNIQGPKSRKQETQFIIFHLNCFGGPKWRKQGTPLTTFHQNLGGPKWRKQANH